MRPAARLLILTTLLLVAAVVVAFVANWASVFVLVSVGLLFFVVLDLVLLLLVGEVGFQRELGAISDSSAFFRWST